MNILFIDDHPEFLREMAAQLLDSGHTVTACLYADDAVRHIDRISDFDVVVLDIMMRLGSLIKPTEAEETGIAIYRRIRAATQSVPVLVISAMSKDRFWQSSGFADDPRALYFAKPLGAGNSISVLVDRSRQS